MRSISRASIILYITIVEGFSVRTPRPTFNLGARTNFLNEKMPPFENAKRPRTLRSLSSLYSDDGSDSSATATALWAKGGSATAEPSSAPRVAVLADEMNARAKAASPLLDSEVDDAVHSLQNVAPEGCTVDWDKLRAMLAASAHLPHKEWDRTAESATALRKILLGDEESSPGLTDDFRTMFERVLEEGNWAGAASHASEHNESNKPWAVLVTGVNGIRKTTSVYQPWFDELLTEALISPKEEEEEGGGAPIEAESEQKLPTGENSFFRQLDHMIATLANEDFQRLYTYTDELKSHSSRLDKEEEGEPSAEVISRYSNFKAAIFARFRTLSEILGILLVREARKLRSNVMIETSGRDIAMFHYVDANFPADEYKKLALHFTINDLSQAESSVDRRMVGELKAGIEALKSGDAHEVIKANAGGPYGSEVLRGVQADSDRVWEEVVMSEDGGGVGDDWYKATIAIEAHSTEPWTARAIRPDGTKGKVFTFTPPKKA